jgi:predicted nucleic acid-binding protein
MGAGAQACREEVEAKDRGVSSQGVTFDTGMLVALERRKQSAWQIYRRVHERNAPITVPAAVLGEWWRGRTDLRDAIRLSVRIEPLTEVIARLAGEALAKVKRATTIDAFVMASAALRGDVVYSGDFEDLEGLRTFFPGVRVFAIEP